MSAWYFDSVGGFLRAPPATVASVLVTKQSQRRFSLTREQEEAWDESLETLQEALGSVASRLGAETVGAWSLCLEYEIPRRQLRPDAVLLIGSAVVVLEFKTGDSGFDRSSRMQVEEYARDLRDFHQASRDATVVPVLAVTGRATGNWSLDVDELLDYAQCVGSQDLQHLLEEIWHRFGGTQRWAIEEWVTSNYQPTPGILETASDLFAGHEVREISHAYADNLTSTVSVVRREIENARRVGDRRVCFVTGVPGSGKTLAGLTAVHEGATGISGQSLGVYLSGNGPLVDVLRYSIARDMQSREGIPMKEAERRASTLIQPVHPFIAHHGPGQPNVPPEHVIVFDEAQRAWDVDQVRRKQSINDSEAGIALDAMSRVEGWSVIVALVGEGQEINRGEAGISSWIEALRTRPDWEAVMPPGLESWGLHRIRREDALHLSVSVRSPRSKSLADWIDAVVTGDVQRAQEHALGVDGFPIVLSRELDVVREYLRDRARLDRRTGLLASSQARRLRAFGIEMDGSFHGSVNWPVWFVHPQGDVRSSYELEIAASEFKCQGLELDWTGVCWGGDFLRDETAGIWAMRRLRGSQWVTDSQRERGRNRYRVLLSRARLGMAIWVPRPRRTMGLYSVGEFDATAEFLLDAGAASLDN